MSKPIVTNEASGLHIDATMNVIVRQLADTAQTAKDLKHLTGLSNQTIVMMLGILEAGEYVQHRRIKGHDTYELTTAGSVIGQIAKRCRVPLSEAFPDAETSLAPAKPQPSNGASASQPSRDAPKPQLSNDTAQSQLPHAPARLDILDMGRASKVTRATGMAYG